MTDEHKDVPEVIEKRTYGQLPVEIHPDQESINAAAAARSSQVIRDAISQRGYARVILATGNSQLDFLSRLRQAEGIDWSKVDVFHLDEYIGLPQGHPQSFRQYLLDNFVSHVDVRTFNALDGNAEPTAEIRRYSDLLNEDSIDLSCLGVGNNGHLAFNDPPYADFSDPATVKTVELDEVSRQQQVSSGLFDSIADVPTHALTVTIPALLNAGHVQVLAPEARKAQAVHDALLGPVSEDCPASVLQQAPQALLYLDTESAQLLS